MQRNRTPEHWLWLVLAVAACTGSISEQGKSNDPAGGTSTPAADVVARTGLRRLSVREYDNVVAYLLLDESRPAGSFLPQDHLTPFDNDEATQVPSGALIDGAEALAMQITERLLADPQRRDAVVGCVPQGAGDAECMTQFVTRFGRRALRRPLTSEEIDRYLAFQSYAVQTGDFYAGVETAIWAFLQDPELLYRVEIGHAVGDDPGLRRLNNFELATRLSFLLWGNTPDDMLLDAAAEATEANRDFTPDEIRELASKMLADPRARSQLYRFHAQWLGFDQLPHDPALARDMERETAALIERVVFDERSAYSELFLADQTFLTPALAAHYGAPAPESPEGGWVPYADTGRKGILSHATFLVNGGKFEDTSPVFRGLAVRTRLLCQEIPPPPPNVNTDDALMTDSPCKWDKYLPTQQPGCIGCHAEINPAGWGLEEYDTQGRFRTLDSAGCEIAPHAQGEVAGLGQFRGPGELSALVAPSAELRQCLGTQLVRFAMGHSELTPEDAALIGQLIEAAGAEVRLDALLLDLVSSPSFAFRKLQE